MADLIGTASIRVDMSTTAAGRAVRLFAGRTESQMRSAERSVSRVDAALRGLRGASVAVGVDDRTAAGAASVRATVRNLQRLGPVQLSARLDTDTTEIANTAAALRGLQDAARGTARALGTLATRATTATAALVALGAAARSLRGDMDDLDGSIRRTGDGMTGLRGRLGTVTTSASSAGDAMGALSKGAALLAPALIPIAVQAAPIAAGLTAATVAIGAFAAAAAGQISAIKEASEAEKTYKDAVAEHGAASRQAGQAQLAYQRSVSDMPHPTRVAAAALSNLKDQYKGWSQSLSADTMPVVTRSFAALGALLPKLTPVVKGAGTELKRFVTIATGGIASPGFDRFMKSFAEFSTGAMRSANDALVGFVARLDTGRVGGGVSAFMDYVRANGPIVRDTLSKVGQAFANILQAAGNVGPGLLTVVNALAGLVAAVPPGAVTVLLQMAVALKAVQLAAAAAAAGSVRVAAIGAAITAMST
ncbi:hypothetical protein O3Q52_47845, partial [Streptomyces sp. ActVer]|nr:hypothetical protein [Streptomyces sp. ActVer]